MIKGVEEFELTLKENGVDERYISSFRWLEQKNNDQLIKTLDIPFTTGTHSALAPAPKR